MDRRNLTHRVTIFQIPQFSRQTDYFRYQFSTPINSVWISAFLASIASFYTRPTPPGSASHFGHFLYPLLPPLPCAVDSRSLLDVPSGHQVQFRQCLNGYHSVSFMLDTLFRVVYQSLAHLCAVDSRLSLMYHPVVEFGLDSALMATILYPLCWTLSSE